jgi:hypothetical protein
MYADVHMDMEPHTFPEKKLFRLKRLAKLGSSKVRSTR